MYETKGNKEEAYQDYKLGMKHKDNAIKQGVSENTIKAWCLRYKWGERKKEELTRHLFIKRLHT